MKREEIEKLRKLLAVATPAPWLPCSQRGNHHAMIRAEGRKLLEAPECDGGVDETGKNCKSDHDVMLTVSARNALPRLLDERDALSSKIEKMRAKFSRSDKEARKHLRVLLRGIDERQVQIVTIRLRRVALLVALLRLKENLDAPGMVGLAEQVDAAIALVEAP